MRSLSIAILAVALVGFAMTGCAKEDAPSTTPTTTGGGGETPKGAAQAGAPQAGPVPSPTPQGN